MSPDRTGIAVLSLLVGAAGAPAYYVILGAVAPRGFVNFQGWALLTVAPVAFLAAWLFSAAFTLVAGGATWRLLHKARIDGFASYLLIAITSAVGMELLGASPSMNPETLVMAAANAILVRVAELHFRSRKERSHSNPPP